MWSLFLLDLRLFHSQTTSACRRMDVIITLRTRLGTRKSALPVVASTAEKCAGRCSARYPTAQNREDFPGFAARSACNPPGPDDSVWAFFDVVPRLRRCGASSELGPAHFLRLRRVLTSRSQVVMTTPRLPSPNVDTAELLTKFKQRLDRAVNHHHKI